MHQAAATYWNQIAQSEHLKTAWAQQMFPLPQAELDKALEREESRLMKETGDPALAAAYLKIMPLLWERTAISDFLLGNPQLRIAIPPMESLSEALTVARKDFRLSAPQMSKLSEMLKRKPT